MKFITNVIIIDCVCLTFCNFPDQIFETIFVTFVCFILGKSIENIYNYKQNRIHNILTILTPIVYVISYLYHDIYTFRLVWSNCMKGIYIYDLLCLLYKWESLGKSYKIFIILHHTFSTICICIWAYYIDNFTDAMASGIVIWMSSEIWPNMYDIVDKYPCFFFGMLELQRFIAYGVSINQSINMNKSEKILLYSAIGMDFFNAVMFISHLYMRYKKKRKNLYQIYPIDIII